MQAKRSSRAMIQEALVELVSQRPFDEVTVRDILRTCGLASRTFYNHFRDKNDVAASIYIDTVAPHLMDTLEEWHAMKSRVIMDDLPFYSNAFAYSGQNNLSAMLTEIDRQKYLLHVKPEVRGNQSEMNILRAGITFLISGQFGLMALTSEHNPGLTKQDYDAYGSYGELLDEWTPPIVKRDLAQEPQCKNAYWDPVSESVVAEY